MSEFERRYGTFKNGLLHAVNYALSAIVIPVVLAFVLSYIITNYGVFTEFSDYAPDLGYVVIIGGCLTMAAFFNGYYEKGSYSRAVAGSISAGILFLFLWQISAIVKIMFDITNILVDVDFSFFLYLLSVFCMMKLLYCIGEMIFYRRRWKKKKNMIDCSAHTGEEL